MRPTPELHRDFGGEDDRPEVRPWSAIPPTPDRPKNADHEDAPQNQEKLATTKPERDHVVHDATPVITVITGPGLCQRREDCKRYSSGHGRRTGRKSPGQSAYASSGFGVSFAVDAACFLASSLTG